ncbi:hypothetical protein BOTBODRAFT_188793 [Botryobasidium botryosum FD-172 SS1]|uniref:Uncharacterized protein n=1 Tax=Botryobasidium botryosum (strain FD-172 SS1) TaxID=930990 RepID=A0A067MMA3_BOTB1|nr:hypothetical protein BOTBODRAFT_188793 [Botryobasidium botryosum FD-172 SS1]
MSAVQTPSAAQAVGEYLKSPDDLLKIAAFRKKLAKEKASIDAKLKSGVKDQLQATREGLMKLFSTRNNVQAIKDEMASVEALCRDPQNDIREFDQIKRVSMVHRNFALTEEMVENLTEMHSKLDIVEDQLERIRASPLGPAPELLAIHFQLNQLENFRNQTMHQAKRATADSRNTLSRHFERLNKVLKSFDEHLWVLGRNILPLVRVGNQSVVVRLLKIVEAESRADEKAIAIRLVKKAANMDAASKFKSMQANARAFKHYRPTLMSKITESIETSFKDAYAKYEGNPIAFIDNIGWMYQDLMRIQDDVVPCFPPDYDAFSFYVKKYHKALDEALRVILAADPEASVLLALNAWLKQYKKDMQELDIPSDLLSPPLLDGRDQELVEDYVKLIISKLDEWTANIMKTEVQEFVKRENPPEVDAEGLYGMQGAVILFQMVNQQVDLATESGQGAVLARVITECNRVMRETQGQWANLVDSELKKQFEKPEEVAEGLAEYVIALANDQIKCADYAETLSARLEPLVSEKYKAIISERLSDAMDGYLDVAKKCTQTLIDLIFNDLKPAIKQLFAQPWYDGNMGQILETVRDYMSDYQTYLNPTILELLVEDLLDMFLIAYLTALRRCSKLRMPDAGKRIRSDLDEAYAFFSTLKPAAELQNHFDVVELIHGLLTASKSLVFLSFWNFAKKHGPNLAFVEGLMKARDDLDRSAVSEVMESVKRKVKDENLEDPPEPTIMKKIVVQSGVSAFLFSSS